MWYACSPPHLFSFCLALFHAVHAAIDAAYSTFEVSLAHSVAVGRASDTGSSWRGPRLNPVFSRLPFFSVVFVCSPGACRQVLSEFGDMDVYCVSPDGKTARSRLSQLLPQAFSKAELDKVALERNTAP